MQCVVRQRPHVLQGGCRAKVCPGGLTHPWRGAELGTSYGLEVDDLLAAALLWCAGSGFARRSLQGSSLRYRRGTADHMLASLSRLSHATLTAHLLGRGLRCCYCLRQGAVGAAAALGLRRCGWPAVPAGPQGLACSTRLRQAGRAAGEMQ